MVNTPYDLKRPKELEEYILQVAADKSYLIFDKKALTIICTRCGAKRVWDQVYDGQLKHNMEHYCVDCGETVTCKEKRYGRKKLTERGRVLWMVAEEEKTYAQLDLYEIDYTGDEPKVWFVSDKQYMFTKAEQKRFDYVAIYGGEQYWAEVKSITLPRATGSMFSSYWDKTILYMPSLKQIGTDLKYADTTGWTDPYSIIEYFANFAKYQSIELLEKAGFRNIVEEKCAGRGCRHINWRGKSLEKILKMTKGQIKEFRPHECMETLERYHEARRYGINVKFSQTGYLSWRWQEYLQTVCMYMTAEKAFEYLDKQKVGTLGIYADYLKECRQLGWDMKNRRILRPKDLAEAHFISSQQVEDNKNELIQKNFVAGLTEIYDKGEFHLNGLMIRPAENVWELDKESEKLRHCVRTYKEKVAKGKCAILFVRMEADPDTPYYTLELSPEGKIAQCRGLLNCAMTDEVKEFVDTWLKKIVQQKQKGAA